MLALQETASSPTMLVDVGCQRSCKFLVHRRKRTVKLKKSDECFLVLEAGQRTKDHLKDGTGHTCYHTGRLITAHQYFKPLKHSRFADNSIHSGLRRMMIYHDHRNQD